MPRGWGWSSATGCGGKRRPTSWAECPTARALLAFVERKQGRAEVSPRTPRVSSDAGTAARSANSKKEGWGVGHLPLPNLTREIINSRAPVGASCMPRRRSAPRRMPARSLSRPRHPRRWSRGGIAECLACSRPSERHAARAELIQHHPAPGPGRPRRLLLSRPGPTARAPVRGAMHRPERDGLRGAARRCWSGPARSRSGRASAPTTPSGPAEPLLLRPVPVEDLLAVPVQHAVVPRHMVVDRLEILDPVRLAGDVGMDRRAP